jgi:hypothetical protein
MTERGRIVAEGMGGFLCPPTHPMHTHSVELDLRKRPEHRGSMSLEAAVDAEWLDDVTRNAARAMLAKWERPALDSAEVQDWIAQVLGYFNLRTGGEHSDDEHAGVLLIRRYYPEFVPTEADYARAYWGKKPEPS